MSDEGEKSDRELNPALKRRKDATHDTTESSRAPADTTSVQREEGRAWPMIWLVATLLGVLVAFWLIFL